VASIEFVGVSKTFADETRAVNDLDLKISDGEFMVLVGPSGCGKTTALRMIAGLEFISAGELLIDGVSVNAVTPQKRDVAMVFQNYALYPHMSVFENIAFPLRSMRTPNEAVRQRVERAAAMLQLSEHLKRKPRTLSGGQRQRVAMGRAIVREPRAFLMDEPLSNLDAQLRGQMRAEIGQLQKQFGITMVYVTHDQVEAMTMGDRIAVMRKGVLQQLGSAEAVYGQPANLFVASFIGSPPMNLFLGRLLDDGDGLGCLVGEQRLVLPDATRQDLPALDRYVGRDVAIGIRSEGLSEAAGTGNTSVLNATVTLVENLGAERLVHGKVSARAVVSEAVLEVARDVDAAVAQSLQLQGTTRHASIVASFDGRSRPVVGERIALTVDTSRLHFFDVDTGVSLLAGSDVHGWPPHQGIAMP